jgi:hypothetical protein
MSDKKFTTEQLEEQCEEARKAFVRLKEQLEEQKKEEEDRKKAELALVKETRKKEVEDAAKKYRTLLRDYIEDYGYFSFTTDTTDSDLLFNKTFWPWWS